MKCYEVYPMDWNVSRDEIEADTWNVEYYDTYKAALRHAKKISLSHAFARIDFYQLNKSGCDEFTDIDEEWGYNRGDYLKWTEKYENGVQVPAAYICGKKIWRMNMQGGAKDLKPRKEKNNI